MAFSQNAIKSALSVESRSDIFFAKPFIASFARPAAGKSIQKRRSLFERSKLYVTE